MIPLVIDKEDNFLAHESSNSYSKVKWARIAIVTWEESRE